jgi:hypothetical protein
MGKGMSITAFVLSLLFFVPLAPLIGLILGITATAKAKDKDSLKGLAIAAIVVGAITTIINIVILALFGWSIVFASSKFSGFTGDVKDCTSKGGSCIAKERLCPEGYIEFFSSNMCSPNQKCCVVLGSGCIAKKDAPKSSIECMTQDKDACNANSAYCSWFDRHEV